MSKPMIFKTVASVARVSARAHTLAIGTFSTLLIIFLTTALTGSPAYAGSSVATLKATLVIQERCQIMQRKLALPSVQCGHATPYQLEQSARAAPDNVSGSNEGLWTITF